MAKIEIINKDFRECELPKGLVVQIRHTIKDMLTMNTEIE
jgi:hypothetical protein